MAELTNLQLTQLLLSQHEILNNLAKKSMTKTKLKTIVPSVTIEEFIENIEIISSDKILNTSLPTYYADTILYNLELLKPMNRPIICANNQIKKFYVYSNGEWIISKDLIQQLRNRIFKLVTSDLLDKKIKKDTSDDIMLIISRFFDIETYPNDKLINKMLINLGKNMPSGDYDSDNE